MRFRLDDRLGEGGFGVVYRATVVEAGRPDRTVALKVSTDGTMDSPDARRRFRDEARILAAIRHPSIIRVYGLFRVQPGWAIVMEYVAGADCRALIRNVRMPVGVALEIGSGVAAALDAAWRAPGPTGPLHVLHRDIKPENIRVSNEGAVKVLDFGAAKAELPNREGMTRSFMMGSSGYIAPERYRRVEAPTGDVYSLGLVLAELLVGGDLALPAVGVTEHGALLAQVDAALKGPLTPSDDLPPETAVDLRLLVSRMMAFDPEHRPTLSAVLRALTELRGYVTSPTLAEWAPIAMRFAERARPVRKRTGELSGRTLLETPGSSREVFDPAFAGARRGGRATWVAIGVSLLLLAAVGGGLGLYGLWQLWQGLTTEPIAVTTPGPPAAPPGPGGIGADAPADDGTTGGAASSGPATAAPAPAATAGGTATNGAAGRTATARQPPRTTARGDGGPAPVPVGSVAGPTATSTAPRGGASTGLARPAPAPDASETARTARVAFSGAAQSATLKGNGHVYALPATVPVGTYEIHILSRQGWDWTNTSVVDGNRTYACTEDEMTFRCSTH
jgi:serine/threonine-protein kinase